MVTGVPFEVQESELEWCAPKLWPSSWEIVDEVEPLIHVYFPGTWPTPDQPHDESRGK